MAEIKTIKNNASVLDFINTVEDEDKKQDSLELLKIFKECTGEQPTMWGDSIIGFGSYHYKSERSSQEGDWLLTGFSPRKQNLTIYITIGFDAYTSELKKLGKHKTSRGCLYIKRLNDVDRAVLKFLIVDASKRLKEANTK